MEDDMILTIEQAALKVGLTYDAISKACQREALPSTWFGKQRQIKLSDLQAWNADPTNHRKGRRKKS